MINKPLLSILIPTVVGREESCDSLIRDIKGSMAWFEVKDMVDGYECHYGECLSLPLSFQVYKDNKQKTIGEKREFMYKNSMGAFSQMTDDDDALAPNAIQLILEAIKSNPDVDVISFEERVRIDNIEYKSNHSNLYGCWEGDGSRQFQDGFHFHRTIFFKDVIRTELAKSVPIIHCRYGEDNLYADALKPFINSEFHIDQQLYYYNYISTPHNERYGIKEV